LIFTHRIEDRHQDHRAVADLTWNTWRSHLILEYEIPKYDGDFASPNLFSPLTAALLDRKIETVIHRYRTQRDKHWFHPDLFRSVAASGDGVRAPESLAEGSTAGRPFFDASQDVKEAAMRELLRN